MKLYNINHIIVLGGSVNCLFFLMYLKKNKINYHFFTNQRMLNDKILNNRTLKDHLKDGKINYISTKDINKDKNIFNCIKSSSLGIGFGQPWYIKNKLLNKFRGNIFDFMGIPMPMYRGGAHFSWMILNNQRLGGCYLQNINEKTVQGSSDSGYYLTGYKYKFPKNLKTPNDFFNFSKKKEILFLRKFLTQVKDKKKFKLKKFNENNSIFFPRLNNKTNGYINWENSADEIVRFINAFSEPYMGAITFLNKKKLYLKNATLIKKNDYHSFSSGLIVNKYKGFLYIAAKKGIIKVKDVINIKIDNIKIGQRLVTKNNLINKTKNHLIF
tara:strand:+ start:7343 stop:8323 length:981 start_codon:yes stop_codon:yes gene_type:complete